MASIQNESFWGPLSPFPPRSEKKLRAVAFSVPPLYTVSVEKKCTKCGIMKPLTEFHAHSIVRETGVVRLRSECKDCRCAWQRGYTKENRAMLKVGQLRWYEANREACLVASRKNRAENMDRHRASCKAWRKANPDKAAALGRAWNKKNRDRILGYRRVRQAKKRGSAFERGVTRPKIYARDGGICYLCWRILPKKAACTNLLQPTMEHVIPVTDGGDHTFANVRLACRHCNAAKSTKLLSELDPRDFPALAIAHAGSFL